MILIDSTTAKVLLLALMRTLLLSSICNGIGANITTSLIAAVAHVLLHEALYITFFHSVVLLLLLLLLFFLSLLCAYRACPGTLVLHPSLL